MVLFRMHVLVWHLCCSVRPVHCLAILEFVLLRPLFACEKLAYSCLHGPVPLISTSRRVPHFGRLLGMRYCFVHVLLGSAEFFHCVFFYFLISLIYMVQGSDDPLFHAICPPNPEWGRTLLGSNCMFMLCKFYGAMVICMLI